MNNHKGKLKVPQRRNNVHCMRPVTWCAEVYAIEVKILKGRYVGDMPKRQSCVG